MDNRIVNCWYFFDHPHLRKKKQKYAMDNNETYGIRAIFYPTYPIIPI